MKIGEFIRQRRNELEISQDELVARLNLRGIAITKGGVGFWERGRNLPPIEDVDFREALALSLEVDVNELMESIGYIKTDSQRSSDALFAASIIDRLPPKVRTIAIEYLKILEKQYIADQS